MDGIINLLSNFDGRIRRRTFWFGILLMFIMAFILIFVFSALGLKIESGIGSLLITIVLLYPACAVYSKRLHDRNKPTMPWLAIFIVPGMLMALAQALGIGFAMVEIAPGEAAAIAQKRFLNGEIEFVSSGFTRLIQSRVFFNKGVKDPLYSGPTIMTPS